MAEECRHIEVDGEAVSVRGSGEWSDRDRGAFAEIVRSAKAKFAAERAAESPATSGGES
jgi:hypothetical protein